MGEELIVFILGCFLGYCIYKEGPWQMVKHIAWGSLVIAFYYCLGALIMTPALWEPAMNIVATVLAILGAAAVGFVLYEIFTEFRDGFREGFNGNQDNSEETNPWLQ